MQGGRGSKNVKKMHMYFKNAPFGILLIIIKRMRFFYAWLDMRV